MSHIYQPVMLRTILDGGGAATRRQIAAAISYHVLFAIVPLFVFLGTIFGLLLRDDQRRQEVTEQLVDRFPLSSDAGVDIERVLAALPTPFSVIGLLSILALQRRL